MVASVSSTPFTSFFATSFSAAIFSISCDFVICHFFLLYVGSRHGSRRPKEFKNSRSAQIVGSPVSEQPTHHAADQAWTAPATASIMVSTTPAATTGRMVVIGFVAAAGTGVRRCDAFGQ